MPFFRFDVRLDCLDFPGFTFLLSGETPLELSSSLVESSQQLEVNRAITERSVISDLRLRSSPFQSSESGDQLGVVRAETFQ